MTTKTSGTAGTLDRRAVVKTLLQDRKALLVVTGLGSSSYDTMAAGDHHNNFYLWGAMGGAAMTALGIAIAQPKKPVAVITGDGEQLMGLGALATVAVKKPENLTIVVLDNAHYGETGMQASHTGLGVDLVAIARDCGFVWSETITDMAGVEKLRSKLQKPQGPGFALIRIAANDPPRILPPRDGVYLKNRFRQSLGLSTI